MDHQGHSQSAGKGQLLAHETGEKTAGFKLHSEYQPTGDQSTAIANLVDGFKKAINSRLYWVLRGPARPSPWSISSSSCRGPRW